jgi:hypothetical protein
MITTLKLAALAAIFAALQGCAGIIKPDMTNMRGFDAPHIGVHPITPKVYWWTVATYTELQTRCAKAGRAFKIGCAVWTPDFSKCVVFTHITTSYEAFGHEVRHCFEGHFHPAPIMTASKE